MVASHIGANCTGWSRQKELSFSNALSTTQAPSWCPAGRYRGRPCPTDCDLLGPPHGDLVSGTATADGRSTAGLSDSSPSSPADQARISTGTGKLTHTGFQGKYKSGGVGRWRP